MSAKKSYWLGSVPSNMKRWNGFTHGVQITDNEVIEQIFRLYRGYAKHYNDIELDVSADLSKQQRYCGITAMRNNKNFVFSEGTNWILEGKLVRGFCFFNNGATLNALRSVNDIKAVYLHHNPGGIDLLKAWLLKEFQEDHGKSEWNKYNDVVCD